jgi:hypothetical protein
VIWGVHSGAILADTVGMAIQISVNGKQLGGCVGIKRRFGGPKNSYLTSSATTVRLHTNDVARVMASFEPNSDGHEYLQRLGDEIISLSIAGDPGGADFESECYLDLEDSRGTDWVFAGVALPR